MSESFPVPSLRVAVWRGLCRRCPRCGEGALFRGWFTMDRRCTTCDLEYEKNQGDLWGFWVLTDRIFLFVAIVALYLGFTPESWLVRGIFFAVVVVPLVATMPNRQGAFVAMDYLSRTHWRA